MIRLISPGSALAGRAGLKRRQSDGAGRATLTRRLGRRGGGLRAVVGAAVYRGGFSGSFCADRRQLCGACLSGRNCRSGDRSDLRHRAGVGPARTVRDRPACDYDCDRDCRRLAAVADAAGNCVLGASRRRACVCCNVRQAEMPEVWRTLLGLLVVFGPLSLFSIGGGASLLAEIEHQSVAVHHWTTHREFADLFAISRAAPGPGTMLSTLIGWKVAGWAGAVTATVALYLPSSLLVFGVSRVWGRWRGSPWHTAIERGLAPIAAGLMLAGGLAVLQARAALRCGQRRPWLPACCCAGRSSIR